MSKSLITQKKIAKEFKLLVIQEGFKTISISSLMKNVGLRRQTFYRYFVDKFDLVDWIFCQEALELIEDNLEYTRWENIIEDLMNHFEYNKKFYQDIFTYTGQNAFKKYFKEHISKLIIEIYNYRHPEMETMNLSLADDFTLLIQLYVNGVVETTVDWILHHPDTSVQTLTENVIYYIKGVIVQLD